VIERTTKCHRCGEMRVCVTFDPMSLCRSCVRLIVLEWIVRYLEFGKLRGES
jgi:ribosomal protein S14